MDLRDSRYIGLAFGKQSDPKHGGRFGNSKRSLKKMQSTVDKFIAGALGLIFLYLLVQNASGTSTVFKSLAEGGSNLFRTLQGR